MSPQLITYGIATVDGVDIATNTQGTVAQISDVQQGEFSPKAVQALSNPGKDLLVFIHGFDNTFSDAVTRAAFNREWLAASGMPRTDTTVIAFSWPSIGQAVAFPVLQKDYLSDQHMAENSGLALMSFLANLLPNSRFGPRERCARDPARSQHGESGARGRRAELVPARQRRRGDV